MGKHLTLDGPVIVGGLNGSGTRVVARILQEMGYYLGQDFNEALDNLWFTLLLKRPRWYLQHREPDDPAVQQVLDLLTRLMMGQDKLSPADWRYILSAAVSYSFEHREHKSVWVSRRVMSMARRTAISQSDFKGWGWKEPHSHFYLPYLARHFPTMKYIHMIRHGLDMAFSGKPEQHDKWGDLFGIEAGPSANERTMLEFWLKANQRAVQLGEELLGERFMVLLFDKLCDEPEAQITRIVDFLGVQKVNLDLLVKIPQKPDTKGRYKRHDISIFSPDEIEQVRAFGFQVDV